MGAILELTSYAATPVGMIGVIVMGAAAYFGARWIFADEVKIPIAPRPRMYRRRRERF